MEHPSYKQPVILLMFQQSNRQGEPVYSCYANTSVPHPVRNTLMQQPPMQPLLLQIPHCQPSLLPNEQHFGVQQQSSQSFVQPDGHQQPLMDSNSYHSNVHAPTAQHSVNAQQTFRVPNLHQQSASPCLPLHSNRFTIPQTNKQQVLVQQPNYQQQNSQMKQQLTKPVYLPSIQHVQHQQIFMSEMTKFMVKKLRLLKFTDIPGTFVSWKTTFQSVLGKCHH